MRARAFYIFCLLLCLTACRQKPQRQLSPIFGNREEGITHDEVYDLPEIRSSGTLIGVTLSGPDTYYEYRGQEFGTQFLLAEDFARTMGVVLRMETAPDTASLLLRLREGQADIVCLQEYGFTLKPGGHTEQELRGELKDLYPYYDFMPNDQRKALGIAVFSKHPIRKAIRIDKRKKGYFSAMYYQLDVRGRTMGLVNMHLRSNMIDPKDRILYDEMIEKFEPDSLDRIRTGMMRALAQAYRLRSTESAMLRQVLLDQHPNDMPLLICGDMNDTPISYCYQSLRQVGLYDTWQETGVGPGITYRANHFWFRIDHMLHSKHFRALHSRVRKDVKLSDHYPVEATFQILPQ